MKNENLKFWCIAIVAVPVMWAGILGLFFLEDMAMVMMGR